MRRPSGGTPVGAMAAHAEARRLSSLFLREPSSPHSPQSPHATTDRQRRPSRQLSRHLSESALRQQSNGSDGSRREGRRSANSSPRASVNLGRNTSSGMTSPATSTTLICKESRELRGERPNHSTAAESAAQHKKQVEERQKSFQHDLAATKKLLSTGFVINPNTYWMRRWDLLVLVALVFTAIVTPYEVAVVPEIVYPALNTLFVVNRLVDLVFIVDMVLKFFTMFPREKSAGGGWVTDSRSIARNYLRGWFTIDLVSILPFDIVSYSLGDKELAKYKVFRIIRLLRLLKLVRILRANRIFKRWETSISVKYSILSLVKFGAVLVITDHWIACALVLIGSNRCDADCVRATAATPNVDLQMLHSMKRNTWLTQWMVEHGSRLEGDTLYVPSPYETYNVAMYWAVMTLTSIGYGDVLPATFEEQAWMTLFMLLGGVVWAYIIGSFCGVVATLDLHTTEFRQTMDELNHFMSKEGIDPVLRRDLRAYFHQARSLQEAHASKRLLERMSPMLKGMVAMQTTGSVIKKVPFLRGADPAFLVELAQRFENAVFAPNELLDEGDTMYQLVRGLAVLSGRIISHEEVWGEDMLLNCEEYQETCAAVSITFVEVAMLRKDNLMQVVEWYPDVALQLRRWQVRLAVQRGLLLEARIIKEARRRALKEESTPVASKRDLLNTRKASIRKRKSFSGAKQLSELAAEATIAAQQNGRKSSSPQAQLASLVPSSPASQTRKHTTSTSAKEVGNASEDLTAVANRSSRNSDSPQARKASLDADLPVDDQAVSPSRRSSVSSPKRTTVSPSKRAVFLQLPPLDTGAPGDPVSNSSTGSSSSGQEQTVSQMDYALMQAIERSVQKTVRSCFAEMQMQKPSRLQPPLSQEAKSEVPNVLDQQDMSLKQAV